MLLRDKDKKTLLQIFSSVQTPLEVWAYGSRVNGAAHSGSDVDLVVRNQNLKPLPADVYAELTKKIRESNIPVLVELRDWAMLPENFHRNIEQHYEVVFSNSHTMVNEPPSEYKITSDKKEE